MKIFQGGKAFNFNKSEQSIEHNYRDYPFFPLLAFQKQSANIVLREK